MQPSKPKKAYRIQISPVQAGIIGGLGVCCLVISFYLGMVTGKSLRDPSVEMSISQTVPSESKETQEEKTKELTFFELGESKKPSDAVEIDLPRLDQLKEKTKLLAENVELDPIPEPKAPKTPIAAPEEIDGPDEEEAPFQMAQMTPESAPVAPIAPQAVQPPPKPQPVAKVPAPPKEEPKVVQVVSTRQVGDYTVQVLSSSKRENAQRVLQQLKDSGFKDAFIHTYVAPDKTKLFRVRVGKMDRSEAEAQAFKLRDLKFIEAVQVTRL